MSKIFEKVIITIVLMIMILFILQANVFAGVLDDIFGTVTGGWAYWMQDDTNIDIDIELGKSGAETSSKAFTERILGMFQVIGSIISVIALCIIGIRYMCSSLEEKAQMKGILIYYIIGCVLVFATSNVLSIAYKVITSI